ncbi:uncharacterized protein LOC131619936 [Vicia villosa]|uniref:uncharacterized protein LOC131619936 n=1 Tax=Vicia villosa TaxID=3911 RepID=UPI00273C3E64|nr:uncharacterized protein LOC131619936 [Vicia villosa]
MCEELLGWKNRLEVGEWVVGGDFYSIKNREERRDKESSYRRVEMEEFGGFIKSMMLVDIQVIGNLFTWLKPNGKACSRLDRILLSEDLVTTWGVVAQEMGMRDVSDHKPVWLKASRMNWGPKVFKVHRGWLEHKDFKDFVSKEWNEFNVKGSRAFVLKENLKMLRARLRWWNINVFGWINLKVDNEVSTMNILEDQLMQFDEEPSTEELETRRNQQEVIWRNLKLKEGMIRQKSRERWVKEGDNNTKFFHSNLRARMRRNEIVTVENNMGVSLEFVQEIKEEVKKQFEDRFSGDHTLRPYLKHVTPHF